MLLPTADDQQQQQHGNDILAALLEQYKAGLGFVSASSCHITTRRRRRRKVSFSFYFFVHLKPKKRGKFFYLVTYEPPAHIW